MPRKTSRTTKMAVGRAESVPVAPQAATALVGVTTYRLIAAATNRDLSRASRKMVGTSLAGWLAYIGRGMDDPAGELDSAVFESNLDRYCHSTVMAALGEGTVSNRRVGLRKLAAAYTVLKDSLAAKPESTENPYWKRVSEAIKHADLPWQIKQNLRRASASGSMPRSRERVEEIAQWLGIKANELLPHVWFWDPPVIFDLANPDYIWNTGHYERTQAVFALTTLPEQVWVMVEPFLDWRANRRPARIVTTYLDGTSHELRRTSVWTRRGSQEGSEPIPTEEIFHEFLLCFFGFVTLPVDAVDPRLRGLGIAEDQLRFSHIYLGKNVVAYCEFQKRRNGRFDHHGLKKLRQDYGLLIGSRGAWGRHAQYDLVDDLRALIGDDCPKTPDEWQTWCDVQLKVIDDWIDIETEGRRGRQKYRKARSAEDALALLLERDRPMEQVVWPTIYWLQNNAPPAYYPLYDRMRYGQKVFMITALASEPHRIENWQGMRWARHLHKREGIWHVTIPADEFKNRRKLNRAYRSKLEPAAQPIFEAYYRLWIECFGYDPLDLDHAFKASYVLAPWPGDDPSLKPCHNIVREHLKVLSDLWDITVGPHAFRHIWSTDYLKRFPGDYMTVAGKLNDTLATVIQEYAHISSADHSRRTCEANVDMERIARENLKNKLRKT